MKSIILRCLSIILCLASLFTFVACDNGQEVETGANSTNTTTSDREETTETKNEGSIDSETEFVIPDLNVEEKDGIATVNTSLGLTYTASGYKNIDDGTFIFRSGLELSFSPDAFTEKFNRFTMYYSATVPTHMYVTYKNHRGEETVADFFVPACIGRDYTLY